MATVLYKALALLPLVFICASARKFSFFPFFPLADRSGNGVSFHSEDVGTDNLAGKQDLETTFLGSWQLHSENAGVSAMHLQIMPNNKAIWFDTTGFGPSAIQFPPGECPVVDKENNTVDCWAHGVEYDIETAKVRTLKFSSDPWCSSGVLAPNGDLVNAGGAGAGIRGVRIISPCEDCNFRENPTALSADRWYGTAQKLEDGSFVVVGGRGSHNYDIVPPNLLNFPMKQIDLPFLRDTEDENENNLFPFVFLLPDGNLLIFANNRTIIIHPTTGKTIRELPELSGGARNFPASGMSALLPTMLDAENCQGIDVELLVCGGNTPEAYALGKNETKKLLPALQDCGRISATKENAQWEIEEMPSRRVMGDMLLLPTGDVLMINGAQVGTAGWFNADDPNLTPVIYSPTKNKGERMKELAPTKIPRMYHSTSAVLPDGKILVAGSNTNIKYDFKAKFPTELRVEKFTPPYLDPKLNQHRPEIIENKSDKQLNYGNKFSVQIQVNTVEVDSSDIKVTMLAPPFTTHGFSQNQRMLVLGLTNVSNHEITAVAPPSGKLAPPGYYLIFVVHRAVPSHGMWVQIQ